MVAHAYDTPFFFSLLWVVTDAPFTGQRLYTTIYFLFPLGVCECAEGQPGESNRRRGIGTRRNERNQSKKNTNVIKVNSAS